MVGRGSIPGKGQSFCFLYNVQSGSEAHLASYPMGTGGYFPGGGGGNVAGRVELTIHLYIVKNFGAIIPLPHTS
jgi:hypothetical protein